MIMWSKIDVPCCTMLLLLPHNQISWLEDRRIPDVVEVVGGPQIRDLN